eukprot:572267_1
MINSSSASWLETPVDFFQAFMYQLQPSFPSLLDYLFIFVSPNVHKYCIPVCGLSGFPNDIYVVSKCDNHIVSLWKCQRQSDRCAYDLSISISYPPHVATSPS